MPRCLGWNIKHESDPQSLTFSRALPQCQYLQTASIFYRACKNTQILCQRPLSSLPYSLTESLGDTLGEDVTKNLDVSKVEECLRLEALQNYVNKKWSPFIFLLTLSSVIGSPLFTQGVCIFKFYSPIACNAHIFPRDSEPVLTDLD